VTALEDLLEDVTAGDPISGLKWTHRSLERLSRALRRRGVKLGETAIARLMRQGGFSLRTNRKRLAGTHDPQRDRQFGYLTRMRRLYRSRGWPVISVDAKKKEWVGNFKNRGRTWRRQPRDVLDHDFPRWAIGRAILYGIYDPTANDGYMVVGVAHETPAFAVAAIRRWWIVVGRRRYPEAGRLLILADSGGANSCRKWAWKVALQRLADEFGLIIMVSHYPPGASKWNPIDHRMFSLISANWAGEPLVSYETVLNYIRTTRSRTGFRCRAWLDTKDYPKGLKVKPEEKAWVRLRPRRVLPQWNYTIWPHEHPHE
jgi:Rhodopirellula transposase DDE domain